jgi:beta-glucosidase
MRHIGFAVMAIALLGMTVVAACSPQPGPPNTPSDLTTRPSPTAIYKNAQAPIDRRVDDLLSRMTLDEKAQQLRCLTGIADQLWTNNDFDFAKAATFMSGGMGAIAPMDYDVDKEVALHNGIQKYLVEQTRLGIPALLHAEGCHGFRTVGATSFPAPIGIACSWDPQLIESDFNIVATEMRARGVSHTLCPIVDICRDPRWGRTDETLGEDPYLNGKLGAAMVRGLRGSATGEIMPGHVAATLKHFAGHGEPEGGINRAPNDVPLREMYDAVLVPFRIAIADAHPAAIMPAYTEVNGVPAHDSAWLLQDVLRQQWHFDGIVTSDYGGIEQLAEVHHVAANMADAALEAMQAGVDIDNPSGVAYVNLADLVKQGRLPKSVLDQAVRRVLRLKFALGLFENPYGDAKKATEVDALDSSKALALKSARESIVLLKNGGDILPLDKNGNKTIAVIGPNAASARLGSYSGDPLYKVSVLDGIKNKAGNGVHVVYSEGCKIISNLPDSSRQAWKQSIIPDYPTDEQNRVTIAAAVDVAKQADAIVLVIGENEVFTREAWATDHLGDRSSLDLPGAQNELADAMFALGKPVIVYLMNGRPLAIPHVVQKAAAVIEGWYAGQETGNAAADILFGDVNPSGKLTITDPQSEGQLPMYYDVKPSARQFNYIDESNKPLFPFGFGLSYTTFAYSDPTLSAASMSLDGHVTVNVTVTNTGQRAGDEIVQFYIHQLVSSVTRPVEERRGFQRIALAAGASQTVTFNVDKATLAFHDINMKDTDEPGDVDMMIGPSSSDLKKVTLHVTNSL